MTAIIRRGPGRALTVRGPFHLLDELDSLARELWDSWQLVVFRTTFRPTLDMYEEKDELVVKAELPGVEKDSLDISLEDDVLHIKAEKKEEKEEKDEDAKYYACERFYGSYHRSLSLPFPVDAKKVSATFEGGVLHLRLPKAEEARPKHIEIKVQ